MSSFAEVTLVLQSLLIGIVAASAIHRLLCIEDMRDYFQNDEFHEHCHVIRGVTYPHMRTCQGLVRALGAYMSNAWRTIRNT